MALPAVVGAVSSFGGLFSGGKQDAYKSDPRSKGLTLVTRGDPAVWRNGNLVAVVISDGVTTFSVPPGGTILQTAGGRPDSGKLVPGGGGTQPQLTSEGMATGTSAAASSGNAALPGSLVQRLQDEEKSNQFMWIGIGLVVLALILYRPGQ